MRHTNLARCRRPVVPTTGRHLFHPLLVVAGVLVLSACGPMLAGADPPAEPVHDDYEEGYAHARGKETPYLCLDPATGAREACLTDRPAAANLSCDAAGCHGDFSFDPGQLDADRHLLGSDGPSCWTCHDQEWSERKE